MTTTRFDEIASRARTSRVRDTMFALAMAGLLALGLTSIRAVTTSQLGPAKPVPTAVAACDLTHC